MSIVNHSPGGLPALPGGPGLPALPGSPFGAAEGASGPAIGAADLWRIIKQRRMMILGVGLLVYILVVAATILVLLYAPQYTSTALLQLDPPLGDVTKQDSQIVPTDFIEQQLNAEAARIKSQDFLLKVVALPEIQETDFYKWYKSQAAEAAYALGEQLVASPQRGSPLIKVALATRDKKQTTTIVDTIVNTYVKQFRTNTRDDSNERLRSLQQQEAKITEELVSIRNQLKDMREKRDMPAMEADRLVLANAIAQLSTDGYNLRQSDGIISASLENVGGMDPRNLPISTEMQIVSDADPVLRFYRQQVEALDIEIASLERAMIGPNHQQMKLIKERRNQYSAKETARRDELIEQLRSRQIESNQQRQAEIRNALLQNQEELNTKTTMLSDLDGALQEFDQFTKDEDRLQRELESIGQILRAEEFRVDLQSRARPQLFVAASPKDAIEPSRPNLPIYLGGGVILALMVGVGVAFLREVTDKAVRTPVDVARFGQFSVLGSIPLLDDEEADVETIESATRRAPQSLVAEAFRTIRAHLTFSGPVDMQRCLLITSPSPGDGKTAIAVNLATAFAQSNQRVLLIDCNFRKPALRNIFTGTRPEGLSNILIGQGSVADYATPSDVPNLDILSSGPMPPTPAELLHSTNMRALIDAAKKTYARIVFDGPPCLLMSDALVLATQVDGVIVVARAVRNSKGLLKRTREQLDRTGARVLGAVLNGVQARAGGYYRQQYREFYDYNADETVPQDLLEDRKDGR